MDEDEVSGGGPLVYLNNELYWLAPGEHPLRFAARINGISSIEVLSGDSRSFRSALAKAPKLADPRCSPAFPVAVAPLEAIGGPERLLVFDACGNWIITVTDPIATIDWNDLLPSLPTLPYLQVVGGEPAIIWSTDGATLNSIELERGDDSHGPFRTPLAGPFITRSVSAAGIVLRTAGLGDGSLVLQIHQGMLRFELSALRAGEFSAARLAQVLAPPFVLPYSAFDQLTAWPDERCISEAVGIGLFDTRVKALRRLNHIRFDGQAYHAADLDADTALSYVALAVARGPDDDSYLFALATRESRDVALLWRRTACGAFEKLSETPIEFAWRSATQSLDGRQLPIPRNPGISVIAKWLSDSEKLVAIHYDGFDVRLFGTSASDGWKLDQHIIAIHTERDDYAFVD